MHLLELEIKAMKIASTAATRADPVPANVTPDMSPGSIVVFDVSKHIALVPPFREGEVDTYFSVFQRIATTLHRPRDVWSLVLQCKLVGKA